MLELLTLGVWLQLLGLIVLIGLSGFFSGSETGLTSLGKLRSKRIITELDENLDARFKHDLEYWLENSQDILISILIGNNLVNIGASALATVVATELFMKISGEGLGVIENSLAYGSGTAVGIMTLLILVFGEISPKSYAKQNPEKFSRFVLPPIIMFTRLITPLIYTMRVVTRFIIWVIGGKMPTEQMKITEDELKTLVRAGRQEGALEESELQMLHSVFEFDETIVREIMVPRIDIQGLDANAEFDDVLEMVRDTGFSRIPVYEKKLDQVVGILNIKDLLIRFEEPPQEFSLRDSMRPAYFVPESQKVNKLLAEFRNNQVHMAIVVDEYGGTSGLITLEDVLEQIVGDIQDEYDEERDWVLRIQDGTYLVDARIDLDELVEKVDVELPTEQYDSLGGMIVEKMGEIPDEGEEIFENGIKFIVVSADPKRVKKIRMILNGNGESSEPVSDEEFNSPTHTA